MIKFLRKKVNILVRDRYKMEKLRFKMTYFENIKKSLKYSNSINRNEGESESETDLD